MFGVLKYTPESAYSMTVRQANLALDGYLASKGAKQKKLMSRNEFLEIAGRANGNS